jgi:hypothetical protein
MMATRVAAEFVRLLEMLGRYYILCGQVDDEQAEARLA